MDAGILAKKERHGLTGYSLSTAGHKMRAVCHADASGEILIQNYFSCRDTGNRPVHDRIDWEDIQSRLETIAPDLKTSVGYFPIFEAASALCVSQFVDVTCTDEPVWEVEAVKERLWEESKSASPRVRLAIDRHGQIYAFKVEEVT